MLQYFFTETPLAFFVMNLWRDEAFSFVMANQGVVDIIRTTAIDFNPPLYYIILHYWMLLFGTSEIALRSLSLIFFGGTLFLLFEIMHNVFKISYKRCLLYLAFIAVNPFLLFYAFEARMYSMIVFLITLSYYAFWTKKRKLYIAAITLALYTHYFSVFILTFQAIEYGILNFRSIFSWQYFVFLKKRIRMFDKTTWKEISVFIFPVLIFLPWVLFLLNAHDFHSESFWILVPPLHDLLFLPFVLFTGYERVFGKYYHADAGYTDFHSYMNTLLLFIAVLPIISYSVSYFKRHSQIAIHDLLPITRVFSVYIWAFAPPVTIFLISLFSTPVYHPRYFIFAVPGFLLLLVAGFEYTIHLLQPLTKMENNSRSSQINKFVSFGILFIMVGGAIFVTQQFNILNLKYHSKRNVSTLYRDIMSIKKEAEPIYLTSELDYHLALYYTRSNDVFIYNKRYDEIPDYVGKVLIPEEKITSKRPLYPHRAFIVYYDTFDIYSEM